MAPCSCVASGKEKFDDIKGSWILSSTFTPGCDICAACICRPVIMGIGLEDRWGYFVASNILCEVCYAGHPDREVIKPKDVIDDDYDADAGAAAAAAVEIDDKKDGRRKKLKKLGADLIKKVKDIWRDKEDPDAPGGLRRKLTFRTARSGRYRQRYGN